MATRRVRQCDVYVRNGRYDIGGGGSRRWPTVESDRCHPCPGRQRRYANRPPRSQGLSGTPRLPPPRLPRPSPLPWPPRLRPSPFPPPQVVRWSDYRIQLWLLRLFALLLPALPLARAFTAVLPAPLLVVSVHKADDGQGSRRLMSLQEQLKQGPRRVPASFLDR